MASKMAMRFTSLLAGASVGYAAAAVAAASKASGATCRSVLR